MCDRVVKSSTPTADGPRERALSVLIAVKQALGAWLVDGGCGEDASGRDDRDGLAGGLAGAVALALVAPVQGSVRVEPEDDLVEPVVVHPPVVGVVERGRLLDDVHVGVVDGCRLVDGNAVRLLALGGHPRVVFAVPPVVHPDVLDGVVLTEVVAKAVCLVGLLLAATGSAGATTHFGDGLLLLGNGGTNHCAPSCSRNGLCIYNSINTIKCQYTYDLLPSTEHVIAIKRYDVTRKNAVILPRAQYDCFTGFAV